MALTKVQPGLLEATGTPSSSTFFRGDGAWTTTLTSGTVNAGGTNPFPASLGPNVVDFTGIPSTAKRVTVMFSGVSTNGTSVVQLQLGTSGGVTSSGYLGSIQTSTLRSNFSSGFATTDSASGLATYVRHGVYSIVNLGSNVWCAALNTGLSNQSDTWSGSGSVTLSGTLDRVRVTTVNGTDLFDAGSINIMWE
jgi:hypothetical protein